MFDSPEAAQQVLLDHFPPAQVEIMKTALVPTIVFKIVDRAAARPGATRIGGAPDLPPTIQWPRIETPGNAREIADRLSEEAGKELLAHFALRLPYTFLAQVDLGEAARLGDVSASLPGNGRLYFFYDVMGGAADNGTRAVRVMWDASPPADLTAAKVPNDLDAAHRARLAFAAGLAKEYNLDPPTENAGTPYWASPREIELSLTYRLPNLASLEATRNAALSRLFERRDLQDDEEQTPRDIYGQLQEAYFDPYYDAGNSWNRMQMLGSPLPEQDDPRYTAAVISEFGKQFLSREEWAANEALVSAKAAEWRLLFQLDLSAFEQQSTEGTVYILIRDEDLKARRFDRAIAVYQQT